MTGGWTPVTFKVVGNYGGSKLPSVSQLVKKRNIKWLFPIVDSTFLLIIEQPLSRIKDTSYLS